MTLGELTKWALVRHWGPSKRSTFDEFLAGLVVLPYSARVARRWGELQAHAQLRGRPRPANDTWIAACCLVRDLPLATLDQIGTEHLLLGLLQDDTPTGSALGAVGVTLAVAREQVGQLHAPGRREPHGHIPLTPRAKRVLEDSSDHAVRLGQEWIARPHLLRSLLGFREGGAARTLLLLGLDLDALASRADELAIAGESEAPPKDLSVIE